MTNLFKVEGQTLTPIEIYPAVSDTVNYLTFAFMFSYDWAGLTKSAIFTKGTDVYEVVLTDDQVLESDRVNLSAGTWSISVVGDIVVDAVVTRQITTTSYDYTVTQSGATSGGVFPPSVASQVYINTNQETPQRFVGGIPKLAADRVISDDNDLVDKKHVADVVATVTADDFNHNDLANKQGGTSNEYYHVTAAEKTVIENTSGTNTGDQDVSGAISTHNTDAGAHAGLFSGINLKYTNLTEQQVSSNVYNTEDDDYSIGNYVTPATGALVASATYNTSGYIPVTVGDVIVFLGKSSNVVAATNNLVGARFIAAYDASRAIVSSAGKSATTYRYTVPSGVSYIRISYNVAYYYPMVWVTKDGSYPLTTYYPYSSNDVVKRHKTKVDLDVFLPVEICVAVGRTIEIYNNQVCLQADKYQMRWIYYRGKALKRKYVYIGSTVETTDVTLCIYDSDELIWEGHTTIKCVAAIPSNITCVTIGDSITNSKPWLSEVQNLSDTKVSFVGKFPYSVNDADGDVRTGSHDGRSGFSAENYLSATAYNGSAYGSIDETVHAFWDATAGRFNWSYYVTHTLSGVAPSAIIINLGTNGMNTDTIDNAANATDIKQIVDYIRQDAPTIPIYLCLPHYWGTQDAIGQQSGLGAAYWEYDQRKRVINLAHQLYAQMQTYANLYFVPILSCFDSVYNFGAISTAVNPRATQTVYLPGTDAVHPQTYGYYQMADIIFSAVSAHTT